MNEQALKLLALGFSVIPLGNIERDKAGKKTIQYPYPWKSFQSVRATAAEVKKWKAPNVGIVTGEVSGLLVLDCDEYKKTFDKELMRSFRLPITPVQKTAGGGRQYFFKLPPGVTIRNSVCIGHAESGIDVRASGGMVVVAPSTTSYGSYEWILDPFETPLAEVPSKLLDMLIVGAGPSSKKKRKLKEMVGLAEGAGRNDAMASLVGKLLKNTPWNEWDTEVWPVAQVLNSSFKPPMKEDELATTYESIVRIETERRVKEQQKEAPKNLSPRKSFKELMTTEYPENRFAIEPFFEAGTMNMVSAPPNTWKSWMFFVMARHAAEGTPFLEKFNSEKAKVLIVNEEDTERLIADRFKALSIEDQNLEIYFRTAQGAKLDVAFCKALLNECKADGISVIFFDSLRSLHDADENSSTAMQPVMDNLKMLTREGITVIFTHHHKKKSPFDRGDGAESSRGSSAINAAISGHISLEEVEKDDGKYIIVRHLKSKITEKLAPFEVKITVADGKVSFAHSGGHDDVTKMAEKTKEAVFEYLGKQGERWISVKEIVEAKIGSEKYVRMAVGGMRVSGLLECLNKVELEQAFPHLKPKGAKNTKFYRARKIDLDENDEHNKDVDAAFELL